MSYDAGLYEAVHRGNPGDLRFYRRLCDGARTVLELGCGYGRVLSALDVPDRRLTGVDVHPGLLEHAAERVPSARLIEADMTELDLGERFDRVIIPHSGIYCLASPSKLARMLDVARRHLAQNGLIAFDAWNADGFHAETRPEDYDDGRLEAVVIVVVGGVEYGVFERSSWDRSCHRVVATYLHRPADGGPEIVSSITHRYFLREEVETALGHVGLRPHAIDGGFLGEEWTPDAEHLVVVASADS